MTQLLKKPLKLPRNASFTSFLASGAIFSGREAAKRATNSRQVPRHIKIDEGLFWNSTVAGEQLQEKLQEAVCCRFFQGSVELLENVSIKSWLCSKWKLPVANIKRCFLDNRRIEQSRAFIVHLLSGFVCNLFLLCHYCCSFSGMHQHWQLWCYNLL